MAFLLASFSMAFLILSSSARLASFSMAMILFSSSSSSLSLSASCLASSSSLSRSISASLSFCSFISLRFSAILALASSSLVMILFCSLASPFSWPSPSTGFSSLLSQGELSLLSLVSTFFLLLSLIMSGVLCLRLVSLASMLSCDMAGLGVLLRDEALAPASLVPLLTLPRLDLGVEVNLGVEVFDFLAAFSALTWLGVFLDGVLVPEVTLDTDLVSSLSTESEVTLRALFILSTLGVFTGDRWREPGVAAPEMELRGITMVGTRSVRRRWAVRPAGERTEPSSPSEVMLRPWAEAVRLGLVSPWVSLSTLAELLSNICWPEALLVPQ